MKFLKIARRPASYSDSRYATSPDMALTDFDTQFKWYCADFFGPVDTWQTYLRQSGYEATDLICGVAPLDTAWWKEHGRGEQPKQLIAEQIASYAPDVLFIEGIESFSKKEIDGFREQQGPKRLIAGLTGTDIRANPALRAVDIVFSCMKGLVADLRREGRAAYFFPHSFDPRILSRFAQPRQITEPLNFIGNLVSGSHMHDFRQQVVEAVAERCGLVVYSNVERSFLTAAMRYSASKAAWKMSKTLTAAGLPASRLPHPKLRAASRWSVPPAFNFNRRFAQIARPGAYGIAQYDLLRRARATLNIHAGLAAQYAANMRLFEATGAGTCLLTDASTDIAEFFEPGVEVLTFASVDEAIEKARFVIDNPAAADAIAAAGQRRTLRAHTFENRIPILLEAFEAWRRRGVAA